MTDDPKGPADMLRGQPVLAVHRLEQARLGHREASMRKPTARSGRPGDVALRCDGGGDRSEVLRSNGRIRGIRTVCGRNGSLQLGVGPAANVVAGWSLADGRNRRLRRRRFRASRNIGRQCCLPQYALQSRQHALLGKFFGDRLALALCEGLGSPLREHHGLEIVQRDALVPALRGQDKLGAHGHRRALQLLALCLAGPIEATGHSKQVIDALAVVPRLRRQRKEHRLDLVRGIRSVEK